MRHSFFHRLPLDLLYYLVKHHIHDSADLLALGASTRAFLFSPMADAPWLFSLLTCIPTLRDFLKRLRRDDFMRACAAEEQQQQHEQKYPRPTVYNGDGELLVPCGACQSMHRRSLFSDAQLAVRTHASRLCKGSAGVVRLCPHATTTLAQLSALEAMSPHGVWLSCHECVRPQHVTVLLSTMFRFAPEMEFSVVRFVKVDEDVAADGDGSSSGSSLVAVADAEPHLTPEMTFGVLKAAAERYGVVACNHMRLDDPETFKSNVWTPNMPRSRSAEDKQWLDQIENLEEM
ncbi:uncharacterized protein LTHEOB_1879 [Lasiodiplodia theobromae]|uniref:uncharacterized protein n=1 Tax=Lasiodiplodia theobromae TaxID=45133 RepID=UPI0015C382A7|nr:uncharacterized protein LTHEOB_1879 [Lasiodiplodia theobromae]KAF4536118.1 hypothetical protein LTHEOB_1879 [Lasiodiplodia theobromae]